MMNKERRRVIDEKVLMISDALGHKLTELGKQGVAVEDMMMGMMTLLRAYERLYIKVTNAPDNVEKMAVIANGLVDRIDLISKDLNE